MWGDTSWRPGGELGLPVLQLTRQAMRCVSRTLRPYRDKADVSIDMGLYRCLPYLMQSGMGAGKSAAELENERQSVIGARCWLAVSIHAYAFRFACL